MNKKQLSFIAGTPLQEGTVAITSIASLLIRLCLGTLHGLL